MGFFKNLFKSKPGGTLVGNFIRGATKAVSTVASIASVVVPGAGLVAKATGFVGNLIPDAPPLVIEGVADFVQQMAQEPQKSPEAAKQVAGEVKAMALDGGATELQASAAGSAVYASAIVPPALASSFLGNAATSIPAGGASFMSKDEIKTVVNGAIQGAKDGAIVAYTDETASGAQVKKEAVDASITEMMPKILLGVAGFFAFKYFTGGKKRR